MSYLGATELTLILPAAVSIGTDTTPLALGEVASIIAEVEARIDAAAAAAGYAVPVATGATMAIAQVKDLAKIGAAARVMGILAPNIGAPGGKTTLASEYRSEFNATLTLIRKGELPLVGAGSDAGEGARELPRSYETSNPGGTYGGATPMISMTWEP